MTNSVSAVGQDQQLLLEKEADYIAKLRRRSYGLGWLGVLPQCSMDDIALSADFARDKDKKSIFVSDPNRVNANEKCKARMKTLSELFIKKHMAKTKKDKSVTEPLKGEIPTFETIEELRQKAGRSLAVASEECRDLEGRKKLKGDGNGNIDACTIAIDSYRLNVDNYLKAIDAKSIENPNAVKPHSDPKIWNSAFGRTPPSTPDSDPPAPSGTAASGTGSEKPWKDGKLIKTSADGSGDKEEDKPAAPPEQTPAALAQGFAKQAKEKANEAKNLTSQIQGVQSNANDAKTSANNAANKEIDQSNPSQAVDTAAEQAKIAWEAVKKAEKAVKDARDIVNTAQRLHGETNGFVGNTGAQEAIAAGQAKTAVNKVKDNLSNPDTSAIIDDINKSKIKTKEAVEANNALNQAKGAGNDAQGVLNHAIRVYDEAIAALAEAKSSAIQATNRAARLTNGESGSQNPAPEMPPSGSEQQVAAASAGQANTVPSAPASTTPTATVTSPSPMSAPLGTLMQPIPLNLGSEYVFTKPGTQKASATAEQIAPASKSEQQVKDNLKEEERISLGINC